MKTPHILIVEDDEGLCLLYKRILESQGIKVDAVANGSEADFKVTRCNYNLIITDIQMPYTDGVTFISSVRKGLYNNTTPIIVVSGVLSRQHIMSLAKLNIAKIFSKPINIGEFATYINTLVGIQGNPAALKEIQAAETPAIVEEAEEFEIN